MPDILTRPDPAAIARAAHDYAHSNYTRIDWTGAQVDFTAGAAWVLEQLPRAADVTVANPAA